MDEYVWVRLKNSDCDVPIGARILSKIGPRIKIADDEFNEYWVSPEDILQPMHETSVRGVDDMIFLEELQEYSILRNLQIRYTKDVIYTYIGSILVAINPYKQLPIYGAKKIVEYRKKKLGQLPPHIFAVADHTYESMRKMDEKRCIIISGESGSGKTESTKLFLQYFAAISPKLSGKERQILDSNPILEAFGNAKTVCNDNSSRFGKYISINFNTDGSIHSAGIKQYLLEKSRIVSQNPGEQNYHIFYALLNGLNPREKKDLKLESVTAYNYLKTTPVKDIPSIDTNRNYNIGVIKSAMKVLNFAESEIWNIFELIAAILHFGNINFKSSFVGNVETVTVSKKDIQNVCDLLLVSETCLVDSLTKKTISTQGENVFKLLTKQEAINSRDAFVKKIFENLFGYIVEKINEILQEKGKRPKHHNIGILDIFGFEVFDRNSFEQLCINYANEKLQQFFIGHVFKIEQEQYKSEGINWKFVDYPDNQKILELIESGPDCILSVVNDTTKLPNGTDAALLDKLIELNTENQFFFKPKYNKTPVFGIQHFAGMVLYDIKDFIEKNHDACTMDMKQVVQVSKNAFLKNVFACEFEADLNAYNKKRKETLVSKFKNSLELLMRELNESQPFFVRCIKPNDFKRPQKFDRALCCKQLKYSGMTEVTRVREAGYPVRYDYFYFVRQYRFLVEGIPLAHKTDCKDATVKICRKVFRNSSNEYQLGRTKIFLKHSAEHLLEAIKEKILYSYAVTIQKLIRGWLVRRRYMKLKKAVAVVEYCWLKRRRRLQGIKFHLERSHLKQYLHFIIHLQARCRGYLIRSLLRKKLQQTQLRYRNKTLEKKNDSADFKDFAKKYFQPIHNHKYTKKPIKTSLTYLVQPQDVYAAKAIWLTILRFTGNVQEPPKSGEKVGEVVSQLREILQRVGKSDVDSKPGTMKDSNAEKLNEMYEKWLTTETTELEKLRFIIGHGIVRTELRDEIYSQICKVISHNPSKKAAGRGWELLSCCTGCFPPSDFFLRYLKSFIRKGKLKYTSFCLFRLHRTIQNGCRNQAPHSTELQAIRRTKPVSLEVYLFNGATTLVKIDSATTAKELLDIVAKNLKLADILGFSLVLVQEMRHLSLGDGSYFVLDAISECEQSISEIEGSLENTPWKLCLKKEMFAPWQNYFPDKFSTNIIFHQIKEGIISGDYGLGDPHLPFLIAQICYAEKEKIQPQLFDQIMRYYCSSHMSELSEYDLKSFKEKVKSEYESLLENTEMSVSTAQANVVKHAASKWTLQFSRFFNIFATIRTPKGFLQNPEVPLVVGMNSLGIFIIDESNEARINTEMTYTQIQDVNRKEMMDGNGYILKITSYEGVEISLFFHTPSDVDFHKLLKKILETLKKYSKYAIAIKNYKVSDKSFLELHKGDLITLSPKFSGEDLLRNSWAEGTNGRSKKTGNFLLDSVKIIPTMQKPPESVIKAIRDVLLHGKKLPFCQITEKLKHYTLESYATKFFTINYFKNKNEKFTRELWKHTLEKIDRPLLEKLRYNIYEGKQAVEIFAAILHLTEYNEDESREEELIHKIFNPGLENDDLKDEIYCQIMKQLTQNPSKESENKLWELMWMATGLFTCEKILANEVKKFLQSRRTLQNARECLKRFYKVFQSEPRKCPPHRIEIQAVKIKPCHILHRVYFPDETHRFFQINSLTKIKELKEDVMKRLNLNSSKEFFLLFQITDRLLLVPEDYYLFDYLQHIQKWEDQRNTTTKGQYKICLMKNTIKDSISNNDIIDLKFSYPQEYLKYIQGYYNIPREDILQMAALLCKAHNYTLTEKTEQFEKILPKLIPRKSIASMKADTWQREILSTYTKTQQLPTEEDYKLKFLTYLRKFSIHNLPYFVVIPQKSNLKNYVLYPVTSRSFI